MDIDLTVPYTVGYAGVAGWYKLDLEKGFIKVDKDKDQVVFQAKSKDVKFLLGEDIIAMANKTLSERIEKVRTQCSNFQAASEDAATRLALALADVKSAETKASEAIAAQLKAESEKAAAESNLGVRTTELKKATDDVASLTNKLKASEAARAAAEARVGGADPATLTRLEGEVVDLNARLLAATTAKTTAEGERDAAKAAERVAQDALRAAATATPTPAPPPRATLGSVFASKNIWVQRVSIAAVLALLLSTGVIGYKINKLFTPAPTRVVDVPPPPAPLPVSADCEPVKRELLQTKTTLAETTKKLTESDDKLGKAQLALKASLAGPTSASDKPREEVKPADAIVTPKVDAERAAVVPPALSPEPQIEARPAVRNWAEVAPERPVCNVAGNIWVPELKECLPKRGR